MSVRHLFVITVSLVLANPASAQTNEASPATMRKIAALKMAFDEALAFPRGDQARLNRFQEYLEESSRLLRQFPGLPAAQAMWVIRAAIAIEINDKPTGLEAAKKLVELGLESSADPNIQSILVQLERAHWMPLEEAATDGPSILGLVFGASREAIEQAIRKLKPDTENDYRNAFIIYLNNDIDPEYEFTEERVYFDERERLIAFTSEIHTARVPSGRELYKYYDGFSRSLRGKGYRLVKESDPRSGSWQQTFKGNDRRLTVLLYLKRPREKDDHGFRDPEFFMRISYSDDPSKSLDEVFAGIKK